jgi:hypothetical protein
MAASGFWSGAGGPLVSAGIGLVGLPFQIASQQRQQDIMRSGLEAQLRAQNSALETSAMLNREGMYAQLGENLGARVFGQTAADLEFGRQQRGREWELGPGFEKELAGITEGARRSRFAKISPEAQAAQRFENLLNMKRNQAQIEGGMAAMFGPKAPTNVSSMVV